MDYTLIRRDKENMDNIYLTEKEERIKKAKAIIALKFATIKENSLLYWIYKGDAEKTV